MSVFPFTKPLLTFIVTIALITPTITKAVTHDELRAQIQNLLALVNTLQQQIEAQRSAPLPNTPACPSIVRTLSRGDRGNDVVQLQQFLQGQGVYTYPRITGYFGVATEQAVQTWQRTQGIAYGGSPIINGFGIVGPKTRAAIINTCGGSSATVIASSCKTWYDGCNDCTRSYTGGPGACTQRACLTSTAPYCKSYFPNTPIQPVVQSVSGPTTLEVYSQGTWNLRIAGSHMVGMVYDINWGDGVIEQYTAPSRLRFTHTYTQEGIYIITVTLRSVTNTKITTASTTVRVTGRQGAICTLQYAPVCGVTSQGALVTYGNECQMRGAGSVKVYNGPCN
tara:strand:+ start:2590 stop:3600 length:1011 start_codon:yes stop_codon:yes gene_type:complete